MTARIAATALLSALLAACASVPGEPRIVYVDRVVYVPVPAELTDPPEIATGPLAHCPAVAAARRAELEQCAARLRAIRAIQGGPASKGQ